MLISGVTLVQWASGVFGSSTSVADITVNRLVVQRCVQPNALTNGLGRCAGPARSPARQHTVLSAQECTGDPDQAWEPLGDSPTLFSFRHRSTGLCATPVFDWVAPDTIMTLQPCDARPSQPLIYLGSVPDLRAGIICKFVPGSAICLTPDSHSRLLQLQTITSVEGAPPEQLWSLHPDATE